jgi:hypothetical protein
LEIQLQEAMVKQHHLYQPQEAQFPLQAVAAAHQSQPIMSEIQGQLVSMAVVDLPGQAESALRTVQMELAEIKVEALLEVVRMPEFKQVGVAVGQVETAQMQLLAMAARAARELQIHTWVLRLFTVVAVVVENERHLELLVQVGLEAVEMVEEMMLEVMQLQTLVVVVVVLAVRTLAEMVDLELLLCATRQTQPLQLMHRHQ